MIDLHIHTIFSDGELIPSEVVSRCREKGYRALALTDHVDSSNLEHVLTNMVRVCGDLTRESGLTVLPGVEITHVPPSMIPALIEESRRLGAVVVVVHGETIVEPVPPGTNRAAIEGNCDILAHPGLISREEVRLAAEKGVSLEITSRGGHSYTNGHVAKLAREEGAPLVFNTDSHAPRDFVTKESAVKILSGAGLTGEEISEIFTRSEEIVRRGVEAWQRRG
ncbi:MAG: histidinol phosphate phosphatase domain-containing protein [Deltaproteobacteria bacterium]|nr:MAG: histidinol phosphate phosphatase domain-containing protein [Deltaproteobacteria bacterium]